MSKFGALPTDNSKTGPSEDSIFYRPQSTLLYQNKRQQQRQQQQQPSAAGNSRAANARAKRSALLRPVGRIALGGKRGTPTTLASNKAASSNQAAILRKYKQQFSRASMDSSSSSPAGKEKLPAGTLKCSLFKKSLGCTRGYVGHFPGSKGPRFPKSRIRSIREDDLQTQLERIQYDKSLNGKRSEDLIAQLKLGLEGESQRRRHAGGCEWWFEFEEAPTATAAPDKAQAQPQDWEQAQQQQQAQEQRRHWVGKPKQEDKHYRYVLLEWAGNTHAASVYPRDLIEVGSSTQLVADKKNNERRAMSGSRDGMDEERDARGAGDAGPPGGRGGPGDAVGGARGARAGQARQSEAVRHRAEDGRQRGGGAHRGQGAEQAAAQHARAAISKSSTSSTR